MVRLGVTRMYCLPFEEGKTLPSLEVTVDGIRRVLSLNAWTWNGTGKPGPRAGKLYRIGTN